MNAMHAALAAAGLSSNDTGSRTPAAVECRGPAPQALVGPRGDRSKMLDLLSTETNRHLLVPARSFRRNEGGREYWLDQHAEEVPGNGQDVIAPIFGEFEYVPMEQARPMFGAFTINELLESDSQRWLTYRLSRNGFPKPAGSVNQVLLVNGPCSFYYHGPRRQTHTWVDRLRNGEREAFVAWECDRVNESPIHGESHNKELVVTRRGRGLVYAEVETFDGQANTTGFRTYVVRIEFQVLDHTPDKADIIRYRVSTTQVFSGGEWRPDDEQPEWRNLLYRAKEGFRQHCQRLPVELWKMREVILKQNRLFHQDQDDWSDNSFRSRVREMTTEEALNAVQEGWQMRVVIDEHSGRFQEVPGAYDGARYSRVEAMLERTPMSDARREFLRGLVSSYCSQVDGLWNYTGD